MGLIFYVGNPKMRSGVVDADPDASRRRIRLPREARFDALGDRFDAIAQYVPLLAARFRRAWIETSNGKPWFARIIGTRHAFGGIRSCRTKSRPARAIAPAPTAELRHKAGEARSMALWLCVDVLAFWLAI